MLTAPAIHLSEILQSPTEIYPSARTALPNCLAYSNEADFDPERARGLATVTYTARTATSDAVLFGRLPSGTTLFGRHFQMRHDGLPIAIHGPAPEATDLHWPTHDIEAECVVLVGRGYDTWGHWIGQYLPIVAAIETVYPGRFRFALPQEGPVASLAPMLGSMEAYRVGFARIVWLPLHRHYRFRCGWAMTSVWSDGVLHPGALATMRDGREFWRDNKVALWRYGSRSIRNVQPVMRLLEWRGYSFIDPTSLSFPAQFANMSTASHIFSVLGSGLAGLAFAPDNVNVVAAGPSGLTDCLFYRLSQHRGARC